MGRVWARSAQRCARSGRPKSEKRKKDGLRVEGGPIGPPHMNQKRRAVADLVGTDAGPEALRRPGEAPQAPKVAQNGDCFFVSCRRRLRLRVLKLCHRTQT